MPAAPNGKHKNVGYFDDELEAAKAGVYPPPAEQSRGKNIMGNSQF